MQKGQFTNHPQLQQALHIQQQMQKGQTLEFIDQPLQHALHLQQQMQKKMLPSHFLPRGFINFIGTKKHIC
jgi:hypothetical protein